MQERDFIPTRRSLLSRLRSLDDQDSWHEFFERYWKLIYGLASRAGLSDAQSQDVVQDTIISVSRQMPQFRYDPVKGSFKSWLFLITRRRIADHLRKEYRGIKTEHPDDSGHTAALERVPDPAGSALDEIWDEEWNKHILEGALQRLKAQVDPKHFQIFDCYVRKEWPVKDVAETLGVSPGQVYLIKHRLSALLAKELEAGAAG